MKNKIRIMSIFIIVYLLLTACGSNLNTDATSKEGEVDHNFDSRELDKNIENDCKNNNESTEKEQQSAEYITIYYINEDATAFSTDQVAIDDLTPDSILKALSAKGVIDTNVCALEFQILQVAENKCIELDLKGTFATYLGSLGTTGEYYTVGSICNTFLTAYAADQIKITSDGNTLSSKHGEYQEYLEMFK